ncbi:MarR family winged helix-turn-helix transcriptional regulator [Sphingobium phenoxybenzoativorans]|uniref:MarR family winged helix-turn-helix transcriptional regulator n=1 Tax=Sphingobium phenoxybenzoativorans TaxID=1592790 RepID=UPI000872EDAE|nr:MarR family transcriptional regulator [Sphingobium phenoxybenzoativorans]
MTDRPEEWPFSAPESRVDLFSRIILCEALLMKRRCLEKHIEYRRYFDAEWTMLLHAYLAKLRHRDVSISNLGYASYLSPSTATRLLQKMETDGLIERAVDASDRRRTLIGISANGDAVVSLALQAFEDTVADRLAEGKAASLQWRQALNKRCIIHLSTDLIKTI